MEISNLPKAGIKYSTNVGPGSMAKKLSAATRYGDLKNLADNKKAILKVLGDYNAAIKRGGLSRLQRLSAWQRIKGLDKNITKEDKREIKQILDHLSCGSNRSSTDKAKILGSVGGGRHGTMGDLGIKYGEKSVISAQNEKRAVGFAGRADAASLLGKNNSGPIGPSFNPNPGLLRFK